MFQNLQGPLIFPSPRRDCCSSSSDRGSSHVEMEFSLWMFRSFLGRFSIPPFIFRSPLFIAKSRKFDGKSCCHQANTSEYRLAEIWSHSCTLPLCLVSWVTNSRHWILVGKSSRVLMVTSSSYLRYPHHICATNVSGCWCHRATKHFFHFFPFHMACFWWNQRVFQQKTRASLTSWVTFFSKPWSLRAAWQERPQKWELQHYRWLGDHIDMYSICIYIYSYIHIHIHKHIHIHIHTYIYIYTLL